MSIIGKNCDAAKQMINWFLQGLLQRKVSFVLILSTVLTIKMTIKQITTNVLIGKTISTRSGTVENNRNSR